MFHQPDFPWNKGISLPQLHFGVEVVWGRIISPYIYIVYIYIYMSISGSSSKPFNVSAVRGQPHLEIWAHQHMIDSPPLDRQWSAPPKQHPWHGPWRAMVGDVAISPFQYKVIANEENDNFCQWVNAWVITLSKMNQFPRKQRSK